VVTDLASFHADFLSVWMMFTEVPADERLCTGRLNRELWFPSQLKSAGVCLHFFTLRGRLLARAQIKILTMSRLQSLPGGYLPVMPGSK
jgi:hypothetical protein